MTNTISTNDQLARLQLLGMADPAQHGAGHAKMGQKPLVLLARLLVESRPLSREAMMAFLWPEASESRARGSLRQALHVLREALGGDFVLADRYAISVVLPPVVDLLEFLAAMRQADHRTAALLYRGPLLDGVALSDATEAEIWLDIERRRLARMFEMAATAVLGGREHVVSLTERLLIARRLRDVTPQSTAAWRFLLEALAEAGDMDTVRLEQAALGARLDLGRIDDAQVAVGLMRFGAEKPTEEHDHRLNGTYHLSLRREMSV